MEPADRRSTHDLSELLRLRAEDVDFFQLVRWAERQARSLFAEEERLRREREGPGAAHLRLESVGTGAEPDREVLRFHVPPTLRFPNGPVRGAAAALETSPEGDSVEGLRWDVDVSFVGLVGPQGVLPQHYTELLLDRAQSKDFALRDLLDLLHQRLVSFFYRAWRKHHLAVAIESEQGAEDQPLTHVLAAMAGAGLPGLTEASGLPSEAPIVFAGHLGRSVAPAAAIEQLLAGAAGVAVQLESFVGRWAPIREVDRGVLGRHEDGSRSPGLGEGFVLGAESWDVVSRVRAHLGPVPFAEVARFHGDRAALARMRALATQAAGPVVEVEYELHADRSGAHGVPLGGPPRECGRLGWSAWLLDDIHPDPAPLRGRLGVPERLDRL